MRIVKWIVLAVVAVVVVALGIVYFNLNSIVRRTVETQSTTQLNTQTTLNSATVSIFGGSLGLHDFEVSSPPGFASPKMLLLDKANVEVSYGQLRQNPVHVNAVTIKGPKLVIEQSGGKFNFKALMDGASKPEQPTPEGKPPMHVIIDKLDISDAAVTLKPGIPGVAPEINIPLPAIAMEKVGTGEGNQNGAALKDVVMQVITTMAAKAAESDKVPPELRTLLAGDLRQAASQFLNEQTKKLTEDLQKRVGGEAGKALEGVMKNPQQATTNPAGAIEQGLGGLLNPPKDRKPKKPATQPK